MRLVRLFFLSARSANSTSFALSSTSRISTMLSVISGASDKSEIERCAFIHFRLGPEAPAVPVNNALGSRQADARAFKFFGTMQALKDAKELMGVLHIETSAIIPNVVDGSAT